MVRMVVARLGAIRHSRSADGRRTMTIGRSESYSLSVSGPETVSEVFGVLMACGMTC
jgi:hypothetical protein